MEPARSELFWCVHATTHRRRMSTTLQRAMLRISSPGAYSNNQRGGNIATNMRPVDNRESRKHKFLMCAFEVVIAGLVLNSFSISCGGVTAHIG